MLSETKQYVAKPVDSNGNVQYTKEENKVWDHLVHRQRPIVEKRACKAYLDGLKQLNLPQDRIPQCPEISSILLDATGWRLHPVPALIPASEFFSLLANRKFPAATFIRREEDIDYLKEPDIFHEVFGHCPILTNQACADFTELYGKLSLEASPEDQEMLARLYWFTIEFGLIQENNKIKAYGGGILSSKNETIYSTDSPLPDRRPFDVIDILRTPYRIDIMQPIYFVLDSFDVLFRLVDMNLIEMIKEARQLGMHKPVFQST